MIDGPLGTKIGSYIDGILKNRENKLLSFGFMPDHVHMLISCHPSMAVADVVRFIKSNTSKWVNENHMTPRKFARQTGYGAFSVSESQIDIVRKYIAGQQEHHRKRSFEDEFRELLRRHGFSSE